MFLGLLKWLREHSHQIFAIVVGLITLSTVVLAGGWWGHRAVGALIGAAVFAVVISILIALDSRPLSKFDMEKAALWALVVVPILTALIFRQLTNYSLQLPIQVSIPQIPSSQGMLLTAVITSFLILLIALGRSLARGEVVSIESHWGGLGGGLGGWRVSSPLIYLLGIVFLLAVSCVVAWRVFPPKTATPPDQASSQADAGKSSTVPSPTP